MFSCEFCGISKNNFFIEHLWWQLLFIYRHYISTFVEAKTKFIRCFFMETSFVFLFFKLFFIFYFVQLYWHPQTMLLGCQCVIVFRSSRTEVFCRKRCSQKFHKIHRKKSAPEPQACNFIKKETLTQVFSCEFCEICKDTFSTEHLVTTASEIRFS